jgi:hypothetical protein
MQKSGAYALTSESWVDVHGPELLIGRNDHAEASDTRLGFGNQDNHVWIGDFLTNLLTTVIRERDGPCFEDIRRIVIARGIPDSLMVRAHNGFSVCGHGEPHAEVGHLSGRQISMRLTTTD